MARTWARDNPDVWEDLAQEARLAIYLELKENPETPLDPLMEQSEELADTLRGRMRLLWVKACHWDNIAPQCKFVVFSRENPHQAEYDKAMRAYQEHLASKKKPKTPKKEA